MKIGFLKSPIDVIPCVYHYTSAETAIEHILNSNMLKLSLLNTTNDPLEFNDISYRIVGKGNDDVKDALKICKEINDNIIKATRILCFSIDGIPPREKDGSYSNDCFYKGYSRARIWSQYADDHKGVCLVFNLPRILEIIRNEYENNIYSVSDGELNYTNKLDIYEKGTVHNDDFKSESYSEELIKSWKQFIFHKLQDYRDEQEYRIAVTPKDSTKRSEQKDLFFNFQDSLETIILGTRFISDYEKNIKNYAIKKQMNIYKISWTSGNPEIRYFYDEELERL